MFKRIFLLALPLAFLGGCGGGGKSQPDLNVDKGKLTEFSCPDNMNCDYLVVPKDYNNPGGEQVKVFYGVRPANDQANRIGILLFNFGGPGGSSVAGSGVMAQGLLPQEIMDRFDIVGMDPRGSGDSVYAKELRECGSAQSATACNDVHAQIAPYMGSNTIIQDMDRLREKLNEETLNFLGYSYGTRLGSLYADRYPERVRAFILDSSMSPKTENNEAIRLGNTAGYHEVAKFRLGHNETRLNRLASIVDAAYHNTDGYVTNDNITFKQEDINALLDMLVGQDWVKYSLQNPMIELLDNDNASLFACHLGNNDYCFNSKSFALTEAEIEDARADAMFKAVVCTDESLVLGDNEINAKKEEYQSQSDIFGLKSYQNLSGLCRGWPVQRDPIAVVGQLDSKLGQKQILVIGGKYDPQTPYQWAVEMQQALGPNASLITVDNYVRHGFSFESYSNSCVDKPVTEYLLDPTKQVGNITCDHSSTARSFNSQPKVVHPIDRIRGGL